MKFYSSLVNNIMNKFMEFTEETSQSLKYFSLLSRVESVDCMVSWWHQQGGKDKVLQSTFSSLVTRDLCFALAVVSSFLDGGF